MAQGARSRALPLVPLLAAFRPAVIPPRAALTPDSTDGFSDTDLATALAAFAEEALPVCFHADLLRERVRAVRHAVNHLLRGTDPLPDRLARCADPGGTYFVPGLGPGFWAALAARALPDVPHWCPATAAGLARLGLARPGAGFAEVFHGHERVRAAAPHLSAPQRDGFLARVARATGRELPAEPAPLVWGATPDAIRQAVREVRTKTPLRERRRAAPEALTQALARFRAHAAAREWAEALAAFRAAHPDPRWEAALPALDDAYFPALPDADRGRLWCDTAAVLRERFHVHPLELADAVQAVARPEPEPPFGAFAGFCADSFEFLRELDEKNSTDWMAAHRERYQFVLREPLVELCDALAERYVRPVLNREHGWELECDSRTGRAVTSICKNDFGRTGPYQPVQWVTFYRTARASKRADAQLFVRVSAGGVRYGFHLGRTARDAGKQFRRNVQEHAELFFRALEASGVPKGCTFWAGDDLGTEVPVRSAADLRAWATNKTLAIGKCLPPAAAVLREDGLVGEVLLTFDRVLPAFACAAEADPRPLLTRRAGELPEVPPYDAPAFRADTHLSDVWLDQVFGLLRLKKQLVLQGVPGTGKTHVARCLARLISGDRADRVRLVQFHPAYSYEEFVEGIRARGTDVDGRPAVTFPVEDGVLCAFAAQAAARPSEPHVLIVDELNRGNLPRVFGELLYLLEYRDAAITLPYSKREFRLPDNLFVLGTMNPLDRSAVALDQALRRRFSFVEMRPDATVLARWLEARPSAGSDAGFGPRVVQTFEELNARLARDLGADKQIGHSFLMVPDLTEAKFAAVWEHHIRPLLLDHLGGRAERLRDYAPERLLGAPRKKKLKPTATEG